MSWAVLNLQITPKIGEQDKSFLELRDFCSSSEGMSDIEEISTERQDLPPSCNLPHRQLPEKNHPSSTSSSSEAKMENLTIIFLTALSRTRRVGVLIRQL